MKYYVTVDGQSVEVEIDGDEVSVDGARVEAELVGGAGTSPSSLILQGQSHRVHARRPDVDTWVIHVDGHPHRVEVIDERARRVREMTVSDSGATGPRVVRAPMPGLVLRVEVEEGDEVASGQGLLIVEAMKMENELRAKAAGRVGRIHARAGETVEKDDVLIEFETHDAPTGPSSGVPVP